MDFASMLSDLDEPGADDADPMDEMLRGEPELVDPEDVAFEPEPEPEPEPVAPPPVMRAPEPSPRPAPRPAASVAYAAPMPDPTLSRDMAEQLLAPATDAAVHGAMARLGALSSGGIGGMTVEAMIRDMLRPMLKDWLDENLPSLVERMVEKEIARVSRGLK
jgi:cell pole-organizing protein PopZ